MRISEVVATVLVDAGKLVDNRRQTVLIAIRTDEGLVGYGEANASPQAVKAVVESRLGRPRAAIGDASIVETLVGEDPRDPMRLCTVLKATTPWSCRSGIGHVALAGVEMALWDLAGKIQGQPVWRLLGGSGDRRPLAYITIYHGPSEYKVTLDRTLRALEQVQQAGYRAAKVEPLTNNTASSDEIVGLISRAREAVGPDFVLLADVGYRWTEVDKSRASCLQYAINVDGAARSRRRQRARSASAQSSSGARGPADARTDCPPPASEGHGTQCWDDKSDRRRTGRRGPGRSALERQGRGSKRSRPESRAT